MPSRFSSWLARPRLFRNVVASVRLAGRLLRDPQVPLGTKALAALPLAYVLSPIDLVPDLILLFGQIDDVIVLLLMLDLFVRQCPPAVVAHHRGAIAAGRRYTPVGPDGQVIDAEYRRL
jgi:uncharacterized membrane protein YkvA (DUF1232 family)